MKAHILIVEDEAILYKRLRKVLEKENYIVDEYTPSVAEAIANINLKQPDIVLLDIDLEGDKTGIDLGKQLYEQYHIPFIYVTGFDDDQTFYDGLNTHHEHFIVKTKPRLDPKEVLRAIQTTLKRKEKKTIPIIKEGILGLVEYLDNIRLAGNKEITRIPVKFKNIAFFTIKPFINVNGNDEELRSNYIWFQIKNGEYYFLKTSLTDLSKKLPYYFVRISDSYIVNISPEMLGGRINGSRISIMNKELSIKNTYKQEVKKRFEAIYQP